MWRKAAAQGTRERPPKTPISTQVFGRSRKTVRAITKAFSREHQPASFASASRIRVKTSSGIPSGGGSGRFRETTSLQNPAYIAEGIQDDLPFSLEVAAAQDDRRLQPAFSAR